MQPNIIPRDRHGISRKQISPNALRTLYRLKDNGFTAYLAGGCVRDLLMKRTPKDFDIATDAVPAQIKRLFRNCRLVGRRFRLAHLHFSDEILEVSTFRAATPPDAEGSSAEDTEAPPRHLKDGDGMVLRDNVFGTPEEDALRRDFTINALAYNIADFSVIDYTTGLSDLEQRLLRPIGDPLVRFTEDPVRMIRAVRFSASHDLIIEPATWETLRSLAPTISRSSPARLYEEALKLFLLGSAEAVCGLLEESGLLDALFPVIAEDLKENVNRRRVILTNLASVDRLTTRGLAPSPALFFAAFFGPSLEGEALALHLGGIPHQQALDSACSALLDRICKIVSIPGRASGQMRRILALQPLLHRMPPRRPASLVERPEFADGISYLYMMARSSENLKTSLEWWNRFISDPSSAAITGAKMDGKPGKRRRKRRRRSRPAVQPAE